MGRKLLNIILFQGAWFAAVLGAANGKEWYGPLAVTLVLLVHFVLIEDRLSELSLMLVTGTLGFCFDTALSAAGIVTPRGHVLPHPFSQPWMISLWLNLAATLNVSLAWLKGRSLLAAIFGAGAGAGAYYGGARLGATLALPDVQGIIILAVGWGIVTPILVWLAGRVQKKGSPEQQLDTSTSHKEGRNAG
ncbi:MAG: DUF2878 domain-containing protein [Deltaproteobacteria bacterium]|nr:DUF2878 domain-containing protein [Deltaproteobacteria bacterium]